MPWRTNSPFTVVKMRNAPLHISLIAIELRQDAVVQKLAVRAEKGEKCCRNNGYRQTPVVETPWQLQVSQPANHFSIPFKAQHAGACCLQRIHRLSLPKPRKPKSISAKPCKFWLHAACAWSGPKIPVQFCSTCRDGLLNCTNTEARTRKVSSSYWDCKTYKDVETKA